LERILGGLGLDAGGTFLIAAAGEAGKALLAQQYRQGIDADAVAGLSQFALNVVDREVALAQGHGRLAHAVAGGSRARAALNLAEESGALFGVVAELVDQHAKGAGRITEALGGLGRKELFDEESAQGLVLPLKGLFGGKEEGGGLGIS